MAFELSFAPEFFAGPYDFDGVEFDKERPTSVCQALQAMTDEQWQEMADEVFEGSSPDVETVMQKIRETNTCGDLRSPVDVYIDPEGYYTVRVYDAGE